MTVDNQEGERERERAWWLRVPLVLQAPGPVFAALREDSDEEAGARQEPATALAFLAGIGAVLLSGAGDELLDEPEFELLLVPFWVLFAGAAEGFGAYWLGGGLLHLALRALDAGGSYRRTRHLLAFAAAPLALSLVVLWPVRLAIFGSDLFREGGGDNGPANAVFELGEAAFAAWALGLLVLGVRVVHGWSWARAAGACALAGLIVGTVVAFFAFLAY
jgi:hypothetical protein